MSVFVFGALLDSANGRLKINYLTTKRVNYLRPTVTTDPTYKSDSECRIRHLAVAARNGSARENN